MINNFFIFFIKLYQQCLSPLMGRCCIYSPSCSEYAIQHIKKYGILKSLFPICKRIVSCNPMSRRPKWDPVK